MRNSGREQSTLLHCKCCNARGAITWEMPGDAAAPVFVGIVGDFHVETGRTRPNGKVVVCSQCDEIHDVFYPDAP